MNDSKKRTRRDFLHLATGSLAGGGAAIASWPFIDSMNPARNVVGSADLEVNLSKIPKGQAITVRWRGKPVFIRHRTSAEIAAARNVNLDNLPDPQTDDTRIERPQWLIVVGICSHLGCVPLGNKPSDPRGKWDGWFCACHGSQYDTSGRVRKGPAPYNLEVPPYRFVDDNTIRLGAKPIKA